ncbi:phage holin [Paenibacillus rhizophilus]|uniref:phage holin n=1 Tax=Paenibacillus rhizophilus TaxID=1850366 RepID=UPI0024829F19|nr:phage holin [Paenibacillus rhizophilus]
MWVSLTAAVLLAVQTISAIFGMELAPDKYDEVTAAVNAILGILVVLGIVSNPEAGKGYSDTDK